MRSLSTSAFGQPRLMKPIRGAFIKDKYLKSSHYILKKALQMMQKTLHATHGALCARLKASFATLKALRARLKASFATLKALFTRLKTPCATLKA